MNCRVHDQDGKPSCHNEAKWMMTMWKCLPTLCCDQDKATIEDLFKRRLLLAKPYFKRILTDQEQAEVNIGAGI